MESTRATQGVSEDLAIFDDAALVERIRRSYGLAELRASPEAKTFWLGGLKEPYRKRC